MDAGEQLVASYLHYIKGCEFTQLNLATVETQGEIDVIGIDLNARRLYVCEVAIHLTTGLLYVGRGSGPNNVEKITQKFDRDIGYANSFFPDYEKHFMFWCPIIKQSRATSKNCQTRDIKEIGERVKQQHGIELDFVINQRFQECIDEMKSYASSITKELKCPIMRMFQIEEYLSKHLSRLANNK